MSHLALNLKSPTNPTHLLPIHGVEVFFCWVLLSLFQHYHLPQFTSKPISDNKSRRNLHTFHWSFQFSLLCKVVGGFYWLYLSLGSIYAISIKVATAISQGMMVFVDGFLLIRKDTKDAVLIILSTNLIFDAETRWLNYLPNSATWFNNFPCGFSHSRKQKIRIVDSLGGGSKIPGVPRFSEVLNFWGTIYLTE